MGSLPLANAGTPLMWAEPAHLLIGNLFIALLEAAVAWLFLRRNWGRTFITFILANYASAFLGLQLLKRFRPALQTAMDAAVPLYEIPQWLVTLTVVSFVFTVFVEALFCLYLTWRSSHRIAKALLLSLAAQSVSYPLLIGYYVLFSDLSLYRNATIERDLSFVKSPIATVYFINPDDGHVWRINTDGTGKQKVSDANIHTARACLFLHPEAGNAYLDLYVTDYYQFGHRRILQRLIPSTPARRDKLIHGSKWGQPGEFWHTVDLREPANRPWVIRLGFYPAGGISVQQLEWSPIHSLSFETPIYSLGFETPFVQWLCTNATVLPNEQVVFQLDDQIVILDVYTRQLGFLTKGRGPLVVLDDETR
jgi:hypothetical protein